MSLDLFCKTSDTKYLENFEYPNIMIYYAMLCINLNRGNINLANKIIKYYSKLTVAKKLKQSEIPILKILIEKSHYPGTSPTVPFIINGMKYTMLKYPTTIGQYIDDNNISADELDISIKTQISNLVDNLHKKGILHGDLHAENLVYDNNTVKIIDFGESKLIKDLTEKDIAYYNKFWNIKDKDLKPLKTINDLLEFEKIMYTFGY